MLFKINNFRMEKSKLVAYISTYLNSMCFSPVIQTFYLFFFQIKLLTLRVGKVTLFTNGDLNTEFFQFLQT